MAKQIQDAYIVATTRTPVGKAPRGALKSTRPDSLLAHVLQSVLLQVPQLDAGRIEDVVVFNAWEVLHIAKNQARALADAAYRPPLPARNVPVAGKTGIATLEMLLVNMRDGGFISPYDFEIGLRVARVLCGGELDAGSLVDEHWLLELERAEFMALLRNAKTQERIAHTMKTGKPLRN